MPWYYNPFTKNFDYYEAPVIFACGDLAACGLTNLGDVTLAGVARGDILRRGAAVWNNYALGAAGQRLEAGALDPAWLWPDSLQNVGGNILTSTAAGIVSLPRQSAVSAWQSIPQGIPSGVTTVVNFDTELFDVQNEFSLVTDQFTATVDGYYQISAAVQIIDLNDGDWLAVHISVNGVVQKSVFIYASANAQAVQAAVSALLYLNATDFAEIEATHNFGAPRNTAAVLDRTWVTIGKIA